MAKVKNLPRSEWAAALQPRYKGCQKFADITPEAWEYFVKEYRRWASLRDAYDACLERAQHEGWSVPAAKTLRRKLVREKLLLPRRRDFTGFDT